MSRRLPVTGSDAPFFAFMKDITLQDVVATVAIPADDTFGQILPWVMAFVQNLQESGHLQVQSILELQNEFKGFTAGTRGLPRYRSLTLIQLHTS